MDRKNRGDAGDLCMHLMGELRRKTPCLYLLIPLIPWSQASWKSFSIKWCWELQSSLYLLLWVVAVVAQHLSNLYQALYFEDCSGQAMWSRCFLSGWTFSGGWTERMLRAGRFSTLDFLRSVLATLELRNIFQGGFLGCSLILSRNLCQWYLFFFWIPLIVAFSM